MQLPANSSHFSQSRLLRYWPLALVLTVGCVLRVRPYVLNRSLWLDEANLAINVVDRSFSALATPLDFHQGAPVGFLWLSKAAIVLLGNEDYILRLVPFVAALLALMLMAQLVADIPPAGAGYLALLLYAIGLRPVYYATEFKQYSSDTLIALLLLVVAMPLLSGGWRSRRFAKWAALALASFWLSHPAAFVVAGIWTSLIVTRLKVRDTRPLRDLALFALFAALSFAALYLLVLRKLAERQELIQFWANAFMPMPPWANLTWLKDTLLGLLGNPVGLTLPALGAVLFVLGIIRLFRQRLPLALALLLPLVFALAASALRQYPFGERMLLFAVPSILVFVTQGAAVIALTVGKNSVTYALTWSALALLLLVGPAGLAIKNLEQPYEGEQVRPAVAYVAKHWQPGDKIYVYYGSYAAWRYYAPLSGLGDTNKMILGLAARDQPEEYSQEHIRLPRQGRLWMLFSHVHTGRLGSEQALITSPVEQLGQLIDKQYYPQVELYLFLLNPSPASASR